MNKESYMMAKRLRNVERKLNKKNDKDLVRKRDRLVKELKMRLTK